VTRIAGDTEAATREVLESADTLAAEAAKLKGRSRISSARYAPPEPDVPTITESRYIEH
jgi:hypothetical protein